MATLGTADLGRGDGVLADALRRAQHAAPERVVEAVAEACEVVGVGEPVLYLVDHLGTTLSAIGPSASTSGIERLAVHGSVAGDVFRTQLPAEADGPTGVQLWLPVSESRCRLGVLAVTPSPSSPTGDGLRRWCTDLAEVLAQLVRTRQQYTDSFHRARRLEPMGLAAELQWSVLPPLDFSCDGTTIAGLVEPAYHVGGDVFDYALTDGVVHFALVDSMGHALHSAIVAGLVIGTYRNCRRAGVGLVDTIQALDAVVLEQFSGDRFATVGMGELDLRTGTCSWVNAGHPLPLVVRHGEVHDLPCPPRLPVGLGGEAAELCSVSLAPGERIVCFSDGVTEAQASDGTPFGEARLRDLLSRGAGLPAADVVHTVVASAIEHQGGTQRDDATMLLVERGAASA